MRQGSPSYKLESIKIAFKKVDDLRMTTSAKKTQFALGFSDQDVVDTIQAISDRDFYKSMEPIAPGFTAWQDVYKPKFLGIDLYVKFQINNKNQLIVSFMEK
jgi:hypothetical protein